VRRAKAGDGNVKSREPAPLVSTRTMQRAATAALAAALALMAAGAAGWFIRQSWFDLRHIELRAADGQSLRHVNANTVRTATLGRLSGNFFTLRLDEARRVYESVPWVAAVSLRRAWPDRLVATLTEHRAVAIWDDGRLLSDVGQIFTANVAEAELDGDLPQVEAPARFAAEVARRLPRLAAQVALLGLTLEAVEVSERASWTLRTADGPLVELGRDDPPGRLDERLALIASHYPSVTALMGAVPLRIDARYPQGFAVAAASGKRP
jgi:cell division protein FtsQ